MSKTVLITGGTGLIGRRLTQLLVQKNYQVYHLVRSRRKRIPNVTRFIWNIEKEYIDPEAFLNVDYIVHLAGESIADKRWTEERKNTIIESRVKSTQLLYKYISELEKKPKAIICASAIGYYGAANRHVICDETTEPGKDFLAETCVIWEHETSKFNLLDIRTVQIRIGIALSRRGGALQAMMKPIQMWFGSPIGSGKQLMPWIHIDDLSQIMIFAIEHDAVSGIYNGVSPNPINNSELTKEVARILKKPLFLPNVPDFAIKIILGEMAALVLDGNHVSANKILNEGFTFRFPEIKQALENVLKRGV